MGVLRAGKLVLLVDEDKPLLSKIKSFLESEGYRVETASNGAEGLEKTRTLKPNLVILDILLPQLNGLQFCKLIKLDQRYSHIPMVILSEKVVPSIEETSANAYLSKNGSAGSKLCSKILTKVKELT
ncbi:MAG: response regulator [Candidatus Margulisbacteria bacterium]|nr:response regulator [Candidatus Margulisiibacteriota bacterium]